MNEWNPDLPKSEFDNSRYGSWCSRAVGSMHNKTLQRAPKKALTPALTSVLSYEIQPIHSFILFLFHSLTHTLAQTHTHASLSSLKDEDGSLSKWSPGHNLASLCPHVPDHWEQLEKSDNSFSLTGARKSHGRS